MSILLTSLLLAPHDVAKIPYKEKKEAIVYLCSEEGFAKPFYSEVIVPNDDLVAFYRSLLTTEQRAGICKDIFLPSKEDLDNPNS